MTDVNRKTAEACYLCGGSEFEPVITDVDMRFGYPGVYHIVSCASCGFCFLSDPPQSDELAAWYREGYRSQGSIVPILKSKNMAEPFSWPKKRGDIIRSIKKRNIYWRWFIKERFCEYVPPKSKVLDFGCGEGYMMRYLKKKKKCHLMGVEPSLAASMRAKNLGFAVEKGIEFIPPDKSGYYNAIVLFQVFQHLMEPRIFLREFSRLLAPKGNLIICCPNVNSHLRKIFGYSWINWHMPFHLWHFSPETLVSLLGSEGWTVSHVETVTPPVWVFQTLVVDLLDHGFASAKEGVASILKKENYQDGMSGDCIYLVANKVDNSLSA